MPTTVRPRSKVFRAEGVQCSRCSPDEAFGLQLPQLITNETWLKTSKSKRAWPEAEVSKLNEGRVHGEAAFHNRHLLAALGTAFGSS